MVFAVGAKLFLLENASALASQYNPLVNVLRKVEVKMVKKFVFILGCCLVTYGAAAANPLAVRDSVGVRSVNGKTYIAHKVEPKETLYALSRKYGVPVSQIVEANKNIEKSIAIGQIVLVPIKQSRAAAGTAAAIPAAPAKPAAQTSSPAASRTYSVDDRGNKMHTVKSGQTLFSISRMHNASVDQIKKWNSLTDNSIEIGQNLIVGVGAKVPAKTASASQIYVPERDDAVTASKQASAPAAAPVASAATTAVTATTKETDVAKTESAEDKSAKAAEYVSRVSESGMAEQIDQKSDANKFLALHKTAPVGTIMAVKNPSNDQTVYVRVVGKLPSTGDNEKLVVKLSKKACQQIGVTDKRFRVELSYMP